MCRVVLLAFAVVAAQCVDQVEEALLLLQSRAHVIGARTSTEQKLNTNSFLQTEFGIDTPSLEALLASDAKLHKFSAKVFTWADQDSNDAVDKDEIKSAFQHLFAGGVIDRLPTAKEQKEIEASAGDDHLWNLVEFTDVIEHTAKAISGVRPSLLQQDGGVRTPSLEALLASDAKLQKFSAKVFKWADQDGSETVDKDEVKSAFQHLLAGGVIDRLPTVKEQKEIEASAGDDHLLNLDEFTTVVEHTAKAISGHGQKSFLQTDDLPYGEQLLASEVERRAFASSLLELGDKDGNNGVDREEAAAIFQRLFEEGTISRFPTEQEQAQIEDAAGQDHLLSLEELEAVIKNTAEALLGIWSTGNPAIR